MNSATSTRLATQARTFLLLAGLTAILLVFGQLIGGRAGLLLFGALAVVMNFASYWFSDKMAIKMSRAQPLAESDDPELFAMTARLAQRAGVPMPRLYRIPQEQPNAFATGRNPSHAAIAVTDGLRRYMPPQQLEGVLAHEFAHIANRDILIQSIGAMIAGVIGAIASFMQFSMLFGGGDDEDSGPLGFIGAMAAMILAPIAATILQLAVSRQREYRADATAAQYMGQSEPLASALETLQRGAAALPMQVNPASEPLYIISPLSGKGLAGLFATHPPLEDRIRRLRSMSLA